MRARRQQHPAADGQDENEGPEELDELFNLPESRMTDVSPQRGNVSERKRTSEVVSAQEQADLEQAIR